MDLGRVPIFTRCVDPGSSAVPLATQSDVKARARSMRQALRSSRRSLPLTRSSRRATVAQTRSVCGGGGWVAGPSVWCRAPCASCFQPRSTAARSDVWLIKLVLSRIDSKQLCHVMSTSTALIPLAVCGRQGTFTDKSLCAVPSVFAQEMRTQIARICAWFLNRLNPSSMFKVTNAMP